jgi:hypothetical protein
VRLSVVLALCSTRSSLVTPERHDTSFPLSPCEGAASASFKGGRSARPVQRAKGRNAGNGKPGRGRYLARPVIPSARAASLEASVPRVCRTSKSPSTRAITERAFRRRADAEAPLALVVSQSTQACIIAGTS